MKTKLLTSAILLLALSLTYCGGNKKNNTVSSAPMGSAPKFSGNVWICNGKTSKKYHSDQDCKGLRNCTHELIEVSAQEAEDEYRRRPCKLCF